MVAQKLLITGAAGRIGQFLVGHLKDRFDIVLTDQKEPAETEGFPFVRSDIAELESVNAVFDQHPGIHTVIHLAADPRMTAPWESLLPNNIVGTYNVFEAAREAGAQRVLYASSVNAVDGYRTGVQVKTDMPVAPANLYGASKAWGEALGRFYADYKDVSVHLLRIGWVTPHDGDALKTTAKNALLHMTITYRDLARFFDACLASNIPFGIWHVTSDNFWKRLDLSDTQAKLGYAPQDDGYVLSGKIPSPEDF